jgi:hypothetical protein
MTRKKALSSKKNPRQGGTKRKALRSETWLGQVPSRSSKVLSRKNLDSTISLMHLDNEDYILSVYGVAAEVWTLINGKNSIEAIRSKILKKYRANPSQLNQDLRSFVRSLSKEKLIDQLKV